MDARKILPYGINIAILGGLVVAAVKYVDSDEFLQALARFDWSYAPAVLGLSLGYLGVKSWRFAVQLRRLARAHRGVVARGYVASHAATLIPGGFAMRAAVLEQAGVPPPDSAASLVLSSIADLLFLFVGALVSALWFDDARRPVLIALTLLIMASALLSLQAVQEWLQGGMERLARRIGLLDRWREFLDSLKESGPLVAGAIGYGVLAFALMVVALDLCARGVGASVGYPTLLLAFTLPTLLGWLTPLPGGAGVTDVGMVSILDAAPGITLSQAVAAVLLFRAGTILFTTLVGGLVYLFGWRGKQEAAIASAPRSAPQ
jgi:uncharacterized membrane protein YbhN (UPF0104 family)